MGNHCNCIGRPQVDDDQPLLPGYVTDNTVSIRGPPPPYEVSKHLVRPINIKLFVYVTCGRKLIGENVNITGANRHPII